VPTLRLQDSLSERFLTSCYLPAMAVGYSSWKTRFVRKSTSFDEQSLQQLSVRSHVIILNERHLKRLMSAYLLYYHEDRTHLGLAKDTPVQRKFALRVKARFNPFRDSAP
jgi:hypothetical protein